MILTTRSSIYDFQYYLAIFVPKQRPLNLSAKICKAKSKAHVISNMIISDWSRHKTLYINGLGTAEREGRSRIRTKPQACQVCVWYSPSPPPPSDFASHLALSSPLISSSSAGWLLSRLGGGGEERVGGLPPPPGGGRHNQDGGGGWWRR